MDPSIASTLIPLVCPYLSYEDTVRCMHLNSSFNRYIDNNWKDMTKKEIKLHIQPGVDIGSIMVTFSFEPVCVDAESDEDDESVNDDASSEGDSRFECTCTIDDRTLYSSQPGFLMRNAEKHELIAIPLHDGVEYKISSRVFGLRLLLDSIVLRFAIAKFELDNVRNQEKNTKLELEVIQDSLQFHYAPTSGTTAVTYLVNTYDPILNDIATTLGAKMIEIKEDIMRDGSEQRRIVLPVDTASFNVLLRFQFWDSQQNSSNF